MTVDNLMTVLRVCGAACAISLTLVAVGIVASVLVGILTRTNDD